jgi:hypothetical protein
LLVAQTATITENRKRITGERSLRENIQLYEFVTARHRFLSLDYQQLTINFGDMFVAEFFSFMALNRDTCPRAIQTPRRQLRT